MGQVSLDGSGSFTMRTLGQDSMECSERWKTQGVSVFVSPCTSAFPIFFPAMATYGEGGRLENAVPTLPLPWLSHSPPRQPNAHSRGAAQHGAADSARNSQLAAE